MKNRGFFITLEGGEGCGKSTQTAVLADRLRLLTKREVIASRSPGGTPAAEKIRTLLKSGVEGENLFPETELFLFAACHSQMCGNLIAPAIERGAIVVLDRFTDSTLAYQGYARGLDRELVKYVDAAACRAVKPDLTVILDITPEEALKRISSRKGEVVKDRFDTEPLAFHSAVRNAFLDMASKEPERFVVVDAVGTEKEVSDRILEAVNARLGLL